MITIGRFLLFKLSTAVSFSRDKFRQVFSLHEKNSFSMHDLLGYTALFPSRNLKFHTQYYHHIDLPAVNYYHKALHHGCCSRPRSAFDSAAFIKWCNLKSDNRAKLSQQLTLRCDWNQDKNSRRNLLQIFVWWKEIGLCIPTI